MHLSTIRQEVVERKRKEDSRSSFSLRQRWKANMSEWGRVAKARAGEAKGLGPKGWRKKMSVRKDKSSTFASCGWTVIIWGRPGMSFDCRINRGGPPQHHSCVVVGQSEMHQGKRVHQIRQPPSVYNCMAILCILLMIY